MNYYKAQIPKDLFVIFVIYIASLFVHELIHWHQLSENPTAKSINMYFFSDECPEAIGCVITTDNITMLKDRYEAEANFFQIIFLATFILLYFYLVEHKYKTLLQ